MSVPKVEVSGLKVCDLQDKSSESRWFQHRGIWFDANDERTERYTLYEIPFFKERLQSLQILETERQVDELLEPFKIKQNAKKLLDP